MWERYQDRADALPGQARRAEDISSNAPFGLPSQYQSVANRFPGQARRGDDASVPYTPIESSLAQYQQVASRMPGQIYDADDLRLNGVRRSGSLMRSVRGLGVTQAEAACADFDAQTFMPPILGYTLDAIANGSMNVADMARIFGVGNTSCADMYLKARAQDRCGGVADPSSAATCVSAVLAEMGVDAGRAQAAAKRMREMGWWESSQWLFYWKYLSGITPIYLNPVALGGAALLAGGGYLAYKKFWKRR